MLLQDGVFWPTSFRSQNNELPLLLTWILHYHLCPVRINPLSWRRPGSGRCFPITHFKSPIKVWLRFLSKPTYCFIKLFNKFCCNLLYLRISVVLSFKILVHVHVNWISLLLSKGSQRKNSYMKFSIKFLCPHLPQYFISFPFKPLLYPFPSNLRSLKKAVRPSQSQESFSSLTNTNAAPSGFAEKNPLINLSLRFKVQIDYLSIYRLSLSVQ